MKLLKAIGISLAIMALFSCKHGDSDKSSKNKPPVLVDIIIAGDEKVPNNIEVNGSVLAEESVELHPEISGRLIYLNIPDGASVTKGTVLARINDADLQAQLEQAKAQLDIARKTEQRLKTLLAVNGVNQADYDLALSQVTTLEAGVKVLDAQIDKTVIRAAFTGRLGIRLISPGAYVTPQTVLGTLVVSDKVKIDFTVPDAFVNLVAIGNTINIQTNISDSTLPAKIIASEPQINTVTRNLKVRALLKNNVILTPGTFVKVILNKKNTGIVVPTNAIIPDALSSQVVVIKKGKGVFTNVETGVRTPNIIELTKGVKPGDSIIVTGQLFVRPNSDVKVRKVKKISDYK